MIEPTQNGCLKISSSAQPYHPFFVWLDCDFAPFYETIHRPSRDLVSCFLLVCDVLKKRIFIFETCISLGNFVSGHVTNGLLKPWKLFMNSDWVIDLTEACKF